MRITPEFLMAATRCSEGRAHECAAIFEEALPLFEINTPYRLAAFFGQLVVESGRLKYVREIADGSAYEGRKDLGNVQIGDGRRYPGRGFIQITGRSNCRRRYERLARYGAPNFEEFPEKLEEIKWAVYGSCDWWADNRVNDVADAYDLAKVSRAVNRGNPNADRPAMHEVERFDATHEAMTAIKKYYGLVFQTGPDPTPNPEPIHTLPNGDAPDWPATPQEVPNMLPVVPALLGALADSLIDGFTSLGRDKVRGALEKHGGDPAVASRIIDSLVDAAKTVTKQSDPMVAVVEAKKDPVLMQAIESDVLANLTKMMPLLEKLHEWETADRERDLKEREAASERNMREVKAGGFDMTKHLVWDSLIGVNTLIIIVAAVAVVQAIKNGKVDTEIWAAFTGLIGWRTAKAGTLYDYRFSGTTRSNASAIVEAEIKRK